MWRRGQPSTAPPSGFDLLQEPEELRPADPSVLFDARHERGSRLDRHTLPNRLRDRQIEVLKGRQAAVDRFLDADGLRVGDVQRG